ncbi:uncharacterized protein FIBRA_01501 [Fibroporia radiculosa]|uniref:Uncharacterized protein n=1 Tax=Fibroporia radiculosa TaxID=599839 RepID=J4G109_9APHY|nr:uncharacterized protein FIBRA_01501 [Fibroporia radiculosa]CCL99483.1 predicted protein [Fibroporia radiculosa]
MMQLLLLASLVQSAIAPAVDDFTRTSLIPRDFTDVDPSCTDISNCRTLWSIIYSCLATIFTCVWVAVHKNISHPKQTRVDVLLNSVFTVTLAVLAPEWMLGWAVRQLLAARILAKKLNILGERAKGEWKRERSELSMQDGTDMDNEIILRSGERSELLVQDGADVGETTLDQEEKERLKMLRTRETEESLGRRDDAWSITHGFFVIMGGFQFYKDGDALYPLSPDDVLALVKEGSLIPPTKDEIKSWSKGDWFSKGIAILQTLWFVIQCIARRAEGLPITTLEVMTLAYTVFTVAMYAVWWHKPLNVKYPVRIPSRLDPHPQPENRPGYWITKDWWEKFGSFVLGTQDRGRNLRQDKHVLTFYSGVWESGNGNMSGILALTLVMLVTMVFGAIAPPIGDSPSTSLVFRAITNVDPSCTDISSCRTLWSIIYSCLATIFACVWVAIHKNFSHPKQTSVDVVLDKVFIVALAVLAPEWILGWAVRQLLMARNLAQKLNECAKSRQKEERLKLSMRDGPDDDEVKLHAEERSELPVQDRANDDEATLRSEERSELLAQDGADDNKAKTHPGEKEEKLKILLMRETEKCLGRTDDAWTVTHGFFVIMGGFRFYKDGKPLYPLSPDDVLALVKKGSLIPPTKDEIKGWSKSDWLSKGIAILQTLWFVIQCIARRVEGLPITTLEVMTLAYTAFTVAMYAVWWHKPLDVECPVRIPYCLDPHPHSEDEPGEWTTEMWMGRLAMFVTGIQDDERNMRQIKHALTFYYGILESSDEEGYMIGGALCLAMVVTMVFGGVHCIAWSYAFPSHLEMLIWRTSALAITALPPSMALLVVIGASIDSIEGGSVLVHIIRTLFALAPPRNLAVPIGFVTRVATKQEQLHTQTLPVQEPNQTRMQVLTTLQSRMQTRAVEWTIQTRTSSPWWHRLTLVSSLRMDRMLWVVSGRPYLESGEDWDGALRSLPPVVRVWVAAATPADVGQGPGGYPVTLQVAFMADCASPSTGSSVTRSLPPLHV